MLLALDSSTQTIGICLYEEGAVMGELVWRTSSHHTVELAPAVDDLMRRCAVQPTELTALGVALGPGSFTSLRIGLALAKGLALSVHIPIIGIPTFYVLAEAQEPSEYPLLTVLPAGRSRFAAQWFIIEGGRWVPNSEPLVMTAAQISESINGPTCICGEMGMEDRQVIGRKWKNAKVASPARSLRQPSLLAEMAWSRFKSGDVDDPVSLAPIYLHVAGSIPE